MDYTTLGRSGLKISRVALGCMGIGTPGEQFEWSLDDERAEPLFRYAVENGITFWDTANVYGGGTSEEVVGRAVKKYTRREDVVLATKLNLPMHGGPGGSGNSRRAVMENVDESLRRLDTDFIDLYQIHRFDPTTPVEETMDALNDVIKAGKVRYIGASSMWAWQLAKMQNAAERHNLTPFISMQSQYNLLQREEEREMYPQLADQGLASLPWSPLSGGRLTRPWGTAGESGRPDFDVDPYGKKASFDSDKFVVDAVERIAGERGVSMAQVSLAWLFHNSVVAAPLIGALKVKHLSDAVAALDITLTDDEVAALEEHYTVRQPTFFD